MPSISSDRAALCAGCGGKISDRYYLLAVDKQWHMRCLKCCECKLNLESELTCFSKDGSIYPLPRGTQDPWSRMQSCPKGGFPT